MLAETAETLKSELTDKYVVVTEGVAELRRFVGLTGRVKTVNMNGRALVEFDGPADISWYDIDPSYLTVIDAPLPKQKAAESKPAESKAAGDKPAPKKSGGMSPLEMARQQGAAGAKKPAAESGGEKKLSPLELARQQGAAGAAKPTETPKPAASDDGGKKLSPLELARQQGAAKQDDGDAPAEEKPAESKPAASDDTAGLSPLELARRQGPAKN